jgi:hypothetical protein
MLRLLAIQLVEKKNPYQWIGRLVLGLLDIHTVEKEGTLVGGVGGYVI